jgi:hypothetical protein
MIWKTFEPPEGRLPLYSLQPAGLVMAVKSAAAEREMSQAAVVRGGTAKLARQAAADSWPSLRGGVNANIRNPIPNASRRHS